MAVIFMMLVKTCEISPWRHVSSLFICLSDQWVEDEIVVAVGGILPEAHVAHWLTHNSCSWLRHPILLHYISSWTIGPIIKIKIIKTHAAIRLLKVWAKLCWPQAQMSSLKPDNIKFLDASSETVHVTLPFPPCPPLLKESLAPSM